ncbi:MAG TPA: PAS domain-containing protein [Alphaproteobacteria bacterium]|nr:PAS domain-containing protein [Alphaproteobacteria bacterium]
MSQEFQSARLEALYSHYRAMMRGERLPRRSDIDPSQMIAAIPNTYIAAVDRSSADDTRFRLQLFGTELVRLFGAELTGEQVCTLDLGDWGTEWRSTLRYAMRTKAPVVVVHRLEVIRHLPITIEHVALPLSQDGLTVDRLIGAIDMLEDDRDAIRNHVNRIDWPSVRRIEDSRHKVPE